MNYRKNRFFKNPIAAMLLFWLLFCSWQAVAAEFDSGRAGFSIAVNNEIYPYRLFSTFVLPGELLSVEILDEGTAAFSVKSENGKLEKEGDRLYHLIAPGAYGQTRIDIKRISDAEEIQLNVFVMVPASEVQGGRLYGKLIGQYPLPWDNDPLYLAPDGYITVTANNLATRLSPHLVLGQFVVNPKKDFPKSVVLRERLLLKLEVLLERLNERGYRADSLSILAAYITPAEIATVEGNPHSRHIYGGAAAVIIDRDGDRIMDDLNNNGISDDADAQILFDLIDELYQEPDKSYLRGGLLLYGKERSKFGPYVMLDARGYRKRGWREEELLKLPDRVMPKHLRDFSLSTGGAN